MKAKDRKGGKDGARGGERVCYSTPESERGSEINSTYYHYSLDNVYIDEVTFKYTRA